MSEWEEEVRPVPSEPDPQPTVRERHWQPKTRNVLAFDRFIEQHYGRDWVRRSRR